MFTLKKPATAPASEMLTPSEAAQMLGVSAQFLAKDRHEARQGGKRPV